MAETRDWNAMRELSARLLRERTGEGVEAWNQRIQREGFSDAPALRAWLAEQEVTGYAQSLLVMERFGYPDFLLASDELVQGQYGCELAGAGLRTELLSPAYRSPNTRCSERPAGQRSGHARRGLGRRPDAPLTLGAVAVSPGQHTLTRNRCGITAHDLVTRSSGSCLIP
jgi:hypothetical protein